MCTWLSVRVGAVYLREPDEAAALPQILWFEIRYWMPSLAGVRVVVAILVGLVQPVTKRATAGAVLGRARVQAARVEGPALLALRLATDRASAHDPEAAGGREGAAEVAGAGPTTPGLAKGEQVVCAR